MPALVENGPGIDEPLMMIDLTGENPALYFYYYDGLAVTPILFGRLSCELIRNVSTEETMSIVDRVVHFYKENGEKKHRCLGALIDQMQMGFDEFKATILGKTTDGASK